ncbi:NAD(P)-binding oxidoreductase [Galactobacter valiniphilus]|uniref:NAD(P)-binding oxidoreductase n=1 Tax=Galactobacter valiniphilus TaxID=2676122 RepID=UPI003735568F
MNITILGASGNVGSRLAAQALAAGHRVTGLVRTPSALPQRLSEAGGLRIVEGSVEQSGPLLEALDGADVAVVCITGSMTRGDFMTQRFPAILEAARQAGVGRVLLISVFGAGDTAAKASLPARLLYRTALRGFLGDRARADAMLEASGLPFTIAYPVNLKDAPAGQPATVLPLSEVKSVPGLPTLPFDAAAAALLGLAEDESTAGQRLLITTPGGVRRA